MTQDIFGATSMGYAVIESDRLERWQVLLREGIGLQLAYADQQLLAFRLDQQQRRFIVKRGKAEDLVALGWHLRDSSTLNVVLQRLKERGIAVEAGSEAEAAERGVVRFWRAIGPKRMAVELFTEPRTTTEPLNMLSGGFVTGASGLGHVAITTRKPQELCRFWQEVFDARVSDHIVERMGGITLDIDFFRVNERHHSIAIAGVREVAMDPIRTKVQHINLLTTSREELTATFLRCRKLGFEIAHEIGEHPNDRELSLYVVSPSGFEFEIGWDALVVNEAVWKPANYQGISLWGHKPESNGTWDKFTTNLGNLGRSVRSLLRTEYSPMEAQHRE